MRPVITLRIEDELKRICQKAAKTEHRSLSNFIIHAVLTYLKENHGVDYGSDEEEEE